MTDNDRWVLEPAKYEHTLGSPFIYHLDGVPWHEVEPPRRRRHRCSAQTRMWRGADLMERCACGAIGDGSFWLEKHSRNRKKWTPPPAESFIARKQREADEWRAMFTTDPQGAE